MDGAGPIPRFGTRDWSAPIVGYRHGLAHQGAHVLPGHNQAHGLGQPRAPTQVEPQARSCGRQYHQHQKDQVAAADEASDSFDRDGESSHPSAPSVCSSGEEVGGGGEEAGSLLPTAGGEDDDVGEGPNPVMASSCGA